MPSWSGVFVGTAYRRPFDRIQHAVEHHPGRRDDASARLRRGEVVVDRLQSHLVLQRADDEFADRELAAMGEEGTHAEVAVDAFDARGVYGPVGKHGQRAVRDAFGDQRHADGASTRARLREGLRAQVAKLLGDLVRQHLLQSKTEQVRGIAAVWPSRDVPARAGRAARPPMARSATVGQPRAERDVRVQSRPRRHPPAGPALRRTRTCARRAAFRAGSRETDRAR